MKSLATFFLALLVLATAAGAHEPGSVAPKNLVQPEVTISVEPVGIVTTEQCGQLLAAVVTDSMGTLHAIDLEQPGAELVLRKALEQIPTDPLHRVNIELNCPPPAGSKST